MASPSEDRSHHLVVVGAAAGIGRWLSDHVFSLPAVRDLWASVTLLDTPEAVTKLAASPGFESTSDVTVAAVGSAGPPADVDLSASNTVAIVAVPLDTLVDVAAWVSQRLHADALIIDTSHDRSRAVTAWSGRTHVGLHPLFGMTAPSAAGQTFALCTPEAPPIWLVKALEVAGGNVNVMTDQHHDAVMATVQTASHQALLTFADVVGRSGLDLEGDLWANRTPVFELLLALAVRVLAPGQDATTSSIQEADLDHRALDSLRNSVERLSAAGVSNAEGDNGLAAHLASLRAPFSGGLFTKISQAGALATSAVQSSRARIAEVRQAGELIGVRTIGSDSDRLHVGHISKVTPTSFTLSSVLVGSKGNAALLSDDAAIVNARRLGIAGKSKSVEFRLGRVDILSPSELDHELDLWLATVTRGCKFLIPESISGRSAVRVVQGVSGVSGAELVSEDVRLGQREVVVRFTARLDRDLPDVERRIIERVDEVFVWPDGVVLALARPAGRVGFLGPAGTFSDVACRQLIRLISGSNSTAQPVERIEYPEFVDMVGALEDGSIDLAVLPITNSSSGLVDLAAGVLAASSPLITAGGVVDVPVRFDAYISSAFAASSTGTAGSRSESFDGAKVYSHPQGFRQCSQFVAAHRLVEVVCSSTAEACRMVAENNDGVALAATGMNAEFGLVTARTSVGNLAGALTRFLVLGQVGSFEAPMRADALQRTVWIIESEVAGRLPVRTQPRYDEVLRGPSGRTLLVSTDPLRIPPDTVGARLVATIPWSPRTPLVVIE